MTGLFHGAAEAGRVRDACMTARSLVQIAELVAKIADAIPHPPTAPVQSLFGLAGLGCRREPADALPLAVRARVRGGRRCRAPGTGEALGGRVAGGG